MPYDKLLLPSVIVMLGSLKKFMNLVQIITRLTGKRTEGILSGVGAMCGGVHCYSHTHRQDQYLPGLWG